MHNGQWELQALGQGVGIDWRKSAAPTDRGRPRYRLPTEGVNPGGVQAARLDQPPYPVRTQIIRIGLSEEHSVLVIFRNRFTTIMASSMMEILETRTKQHDQLICLACGAKLVERMVMKGINVGEKYWGCANLPACRFTRKKTRIAN